MPALIRATDLRMSFGDRRALDGVSFEVAAGEVVGLLGPNGAGKTTTLSVLATLRRPQGGGAEVAGHDVVAAAAAVRRELGYVPQSLAIYPTLTAQENATFFARMFGMDRATAGAATARVLEIVGLAERGGDIVATFSGGMQRRLNLACGLLHAPRALLLDEPTVGVDPQSRERIFAAVRAQAAGGASVLYSTHYMEEAERLCDRVVLIDAGRVVASGTPSELIDRFGGSSQLDVATRVALPPTWLDGIAGARAVTGPEADDGRFRTRVALDDVGGAAPVLERAARHGGAVVDFHLHQPSLQEVYLRLTGHALRD